MTTDQENLGGLGTEQVRGDLAHLDELSTEDLVSLMVRDTQKVPAALSLAEEQLVHAVSAIVDRMRRGGRLLYVGAGTAGRLGMLDAAEAGPTFNVDDGQVQGILAGGSNAFGVPVENAEDDFEGGAVAVREREVSALDCVVGVSASGRTPFVLGAMNEAAQRGALTVGISCNAHTALSHAVRYPIEVVVGPEIIAGSTRLNAGTAQKLVLNVISTATMVELGKTYGNLMVDVRPTNEKLRDRALRIVAEITDAPLERVHRALQESSWRTKVASVMLVGELDADHASRALERHHGRLRATLDDVRSFAPRVTTSSWTRLGVSAALVDGTLVSGDVAIENGQIMAIGLSGSGRGIAIRGFVDAQLNGYAGVDLLSASVSDIVEMCEALRRDGVSAFQPNLITSDVNKMLAAMSRLREARLFGSGARILDFHLEGPFLSSLRAGTHPREYLLNPDVEILDALLAGGDVKMMTIAPELPGSLELISTLVQRDIVVALGHSAATSEQARRGFDAGASAVTHLFNAMEPITARSPGLAGVALSRDDVVIQLLGDGVHVANELLRIAFRAAPQRCVLVTDAIAAAASRKSTVQLGDVTVHVEGGVARREDGTIAGSIGRLRDTVTRVLEIGVDRSEVLHAVTTTPSNFLGQPGLGDVRVGEPADLVILDEQLRINRRVEKGLDVDL